MRRSRKTIRKPETLGKNNVSQTYFDVKMDFHGYTGNEAIRELEEELSVCDGESLLIVHGKGDGILRRRIRAYLAGCDGVDVEYGEEANIPGGDGVTVVFT